MRCNVGSVEKYSLYDVTLLLTTDITLLLPCMTVVLYATIHFISVKV